MDDIQSELKEIPCWTMAYVRREFNQAARVMARLAASKEMDTLWFHSPPKI